MFRLNKKLINFILFIFSLNIFAEDILEKLDVINYSVTAKTIITNTQLDLKKIVLIFPLPLTNEYQEVEIINLNNGEVIDIPQSQDKYIRYTLEGNDLPLKNKKKEVIYNYKVKLYSINTNFTKINEIHPYDKSSNIYKLYTVNNNEFVNLENKKIKNISNELWNNSKDYLDYAKKCYEYTAKEFKYLYPNTGIHSLEKILSDGGGDCGNFSLIFINLLRSKGIPSRFLVAKRPDNSDHVWADFYLENYGWIPVDATYKNSNKDGDFFGIVSKNDNGIILSKDVNVNVEIEKNVYAKINILQNYTYWYWNSGGHGELKVDFKINSKRIE